MSKIAVITYRNSPHSVKQIIEQAFSHISPKNINNHIEVIQSNVALNTYIGVLNSELSLKEETNEILSGFTLNNIITENKLDDGSYLKIKLQEQEITCNVDRFESKSLWYYKDEEKFIISNSQLLITSLKGSFKINKKAVSWFLSSGSTGFRNSWDIEINKVLHSKEYKFSIADWKLDIMEKNYAVENIQYNTNQEFLGKYKDLTKNVFINLAKDFPVSNMVLPLSGGNDSRLLFYISNELKQFNSMTLANWGVKKESQVFDDKIAALQIAQAYNKNLKNYYLPSKIEDFDSFFNSFIRNGDCRIDHFNAYADEFKIFQQLYHEDYNFIIRGDIPFTEGLDVNDKMSRAHIGIPKWTDYANYQSYILDDFVEVQESDQVPIQKKESETLIEWRDRLYIDFRIPIVISAFDDLINPYLVTIAPMMTYSHYLLYSQQEPSKRGDKAHIVKLSKELDQSKIGFNATTSILAMEDYLNTKEGIIYLQSYLNQMDNAIFSRDMIDSISKHLNLSTPGKQLLKRQLIEFAKENLPTKLKILIRSKYSKSLSALTLSYRIIMVDKVFQTFNKAAQ